MRSAMRREGKGARVWRKVPDESIMFVNTLEGKQGIACKYCPSCGETKALGQFYYKGLSKRIKHPISDKHERICVVCWDATKKKQKKDRAELLNPSNTVMNFI